MANSDSPPSQSGNDLKKVTEKTNNHNDSSSTPIIKIDSDKSSRWRFLTSWPFLTVLTMLIFSGLGFVAVALLFKLPAVPNCPTIFWPAASASLRLYCAQIAANKQTADNLLEAIALVNSLPADHSLRPEINRNIEEWSLNILKLAENEFQAGKLSEAIALAKKIPDNLPVYKLREKQISQWQSVWERAEKIYQKAIAELRESHWNQAFTEAVHLAYIDNKYWSTTKYEELSNQILTGRADSGKLDKAYQLNKGGGLDNLLEAVKLAEQIGANSYAYKESKDLMADCGRKLLKLALDNLDKKDWNQVLQIANKIPASLNLKLQSQDLITLANAQSHAVKGTVADIEEAITEAQKLELGRPLRDQAQDLIARWQQEIEDVAHLQQARNLAKAGAISDLTTAIAEAQLIKTNNPRFQEAQTQIQKWNAEIQTQEDRPYLDRGEQLANAGDITSLQAAIDQVKQIGNGRALYAQAQRRIEQWTGKIERMQDQPYLDRAEQIANTGDVTSLQAAIDQLNQIGNGRILYGEAQSKIGRWKRKIQQIQDQPVLSTAEGLANSGNLQEAIAAAQKIKRERALYEDAQAKVRAWQREIRAQDNLQSAYQTANAGTPEAIATAIRLAKKIPLSTSVGSNAMEASNRWSYQLLAMAQNQVGFDIRKAIAIAKTIPSGTEAYNAAQQQIQAWERSLNPVPLNNFPTQ